MNDESKPQFGPYKAKKLLGSGGTSRVWLAAGQGQTVAVKCLKDKKYLPNLVAELEILESVNHNAFPKVLTSDRDGMWFAMEYIQGPSIGKWCKTEGLDGIRTVFLDLCHALEVLHDSGKIHGDIKTSNIRMEPSGRTKLIDFGSTSSTLPRTAKFTGTFGYVAPEILRGQAATPLSDIYGLGVVLYEALTGRSPFPTRDPAALAYVPLISLPVPPSAFEADIPEAWDSLVLEMLCRSPNQRPPAIRALIERLKALPLERTHPAITGLLHQREALGRAVMAVADGETRLLVLYGPPGSGRKTLIKETLKHARRQGLKPTKSARLEAVRKGHQKPKQPPVLALTGHHPELAEIASDLFRLKQPALILVHALRPVPSVKEWAEYLTPSPLSVENIQTLLNGLTYHTFDAKKLWQQTHGHPATLMRMLQASGNQTSNDPLTKREQQIVNALEQYGSMAAPDLAAHLSLHEHDLLDLLSPLLAGGWIQNHQQKLRLTKD